MAARRMGRGPQLGLAVVAVSAAPYMAGCATDPPPDGALDYAMVCTTREERAVRLPDESCREAGPTGRAVGEWRWAQLPPSPVQEVPVTRTDEDGYDYEDVDMVPDTDGGGVFIAAIGSPIYGGVNPGWSRNPPPVAAMSRTARGVSSTAGMLTRSGAGSAGFGGGTAIRTVGSSGGALVRQPSPFVARGGLGGTGYSGSSGS